MRVLHIAAGNLYGGVERIVEEVARHGGGRHDFALAFDGRLSQGLAASGARVTQLGEVRFSRPASVWSARRRLTGVLEHTEYDVVVGHSPWAYALAAPVARRAGVRRVLWAHDALHGQHWTERKVARFSPDLAVCNSRFSAEVLGEWLARVPREVVYAPVSPFVADPAGRCLKRREIGTDDTSVVILMATRFEPCKDHAELRGAAASLAGNWTIWIAGGAQRPHERKYERELRTMAAALPDPRRVVFLGERSDVGALLQAADLHCQPNTGPDAFGLAFVEALYAGVPVVTSDLGGASEIVTASCGILIPAGDRAALVASLQSLVDDPVRRAALGAEGPKRARLLCDPDTQMSALERVLTQCA
jgi:glycosyltransferase involved in cell wall biosynthesis